MNFIVRTRRTGQLVVLIAVSSGILLSCAGGPLSTLFDNEAPAEVSNLAVDSDETQIELSWTDPPDNDLDHVVVSWGDGNNQSSAAQGVEEHTASALTSGSTYTFVVKTMDAAGNTSSGVTRHVATDVPYTLDVTWESASEGASHGNFPDRSRPQSGARWAE
ncbi:MAG: hypothetical protein GVY29_13050 [Spirochaetes bacterium]|jgi:hypothetical protein|nr:hypothetical protein [Spirochaetota bacterium]